MSRIVAEKTNLKTHKDLDVWKKSMDLVEEVYRFTQSFPVSEKYELIKYLKSK
ncbi:MAG: four helix bundle protein [Candidatus Marinimicrobia bacterium]|nr:four helix bundle protein [Candidatus Neomarinimicrobiota bacterium]MDD9888223.1 four helix bundle protein [Candidatus Neomarinimicrobiota bacterium]MDD9930526.1 four helix bundle protein [Candidatus Neomarinimicrobiota bacterium]